MDFKKGTRKMNNQTVQKLDNEQIKAIVDKIVPQIAKPEDHEFFRGILFIKLESCESSSQAASFVSKVLKEAGK